MAEPDQISSLLKQIKSIESRLVEVENIKAPHNVYGKIETLFQSLDDIQSKISYRNILFFYKISISNII